MLNIGAFARLGQVSPRMLRHYDRLGLLVPDEVDPDSGYRSYGVEQLARLHRLLALRDLGFSLEQIGAILKSELTVGELRGMLRLRQAELEQSVTEEQDRLQRVEAHLRAIERKDAMSAQDVVVKRTEPLRVAEIRGTAKALDPEHIGPIFVELAPSVAAAIGRQGARPGLLVGYYDDPDEDGSVGVHVAFEVGDQNVASTDGLDVVDLPVIEVASVIHEGPMEGVVAVYESLVRWIEDSGYRLTGHSRELYHEMGEHGPLVTELQMPIAR
jgi:DNA-binding transcriptional MerR regulator